MSSIRSTDQQQRPNFCVALCTCPTLENAKKLAHELLEKKLVACINCIPNICSIYRWQDKIEESMECLLLIKTTKEQFTALKEAIVILHDYDVPEVIQLDITDGHHPYLDWIKQCT